MAQDVGYLAIGELTPAGEAIVEMSARGDEARASALRVALTDATASYGQIACEVGRSKSTVQHWIETLRGQLRGVIASGRVTASDLVVGLDTVDDLLQQQHADHQPDDPSDRLGHDHTAAESAA